MIWDTTEKIMAYNLVVSNICCTIVPTLTIKTNIMTLTRFYDTLQNNLVDDQFIMDLTDKDYDLIVADLNYPEVIEKFMTNA